MADDATLSLNSRPLIASLEQAQKALVDFEAFARRFDSEQGGGSQAAQQQYAQLLAQLRELSAAYDTAAAKRRSFVESTAAPRIAGGTPGLSTSGGQAGPALSSQARGAIEQLGTLTDAAARRLGPELGGKLTATVQDLIKSVGQSAATQFDTEKRDLLARIQTRSLAGQDVRAENATGPAGLLGRQPSLGRVATSTAAQVGAGTFINRPLTEGSDAQARRRQNLIEANRNLATSETNVGEAASRASQLEQALNNATLAQLRQLNALEEQHNRLLAERAALAALAVPKGKVFENGAQRRGQPLSEATGVSPVPTLNARGQIDQGAARATLANAKSERLADFDRQLATSLGNISGFRSGLIDSQAALRVFDENFRRVTRNVGYNVPADRFENARTREPIIDPAVNNDLRRILNGRVANEQRAATGGTPLFGNAGVSRNDQGEVFATSNGALLSEAAARKALKDSDDRLAKAQDEAAALFRRDRLRTRIDSGDGARRLAGNPNLGLDQRTNQVVNLKNGALLDSANAERALAVETQRTLTGQRSLARATESATNVRNAALISDARSVERAGRFARVTDNGRDRTFQLSTNGRSAQELFANSPNFAQADRALQEVARANTEQALAARLLADLERKAATRIGQNTVAQNGKYYQFTNGGTRARELQGFNEVNAQQQDPRNRSVGANFLGGLTSRGFGAGNGQFDLGGLAQSAGTTVKYTALYSALNQVQQAATQAITSLLNYEDSIVNISLAYEDGAEPSQLFINSLQDIAASAGSNVGDVMDQAAVAMRAFGGETKQTDAELNKFATDFAQTVSRLSIITGQDYDAVANQTRAAVGALTQGSAQEGTGKYTTAARQFEDAVAGARNFGGDAADISDGFRAIATTAAQAGFSANETANIASIVTARLGESGQLAGTRLQRVFSILGGSTGQNALRKLNASLEPEQQINLGGTVSDQVRELSGIYDELDSKQKTALTSALGGTNNTGELVVLLQQGNRVLEQNGQSFDYAGKSAEEYGKISENLSGYLRQLKGNAEGIDTALGQSGILGPIKAVAFILLQATKTVREFVQAVNALTSGFGTIPNQVREIGTALLAVYAVMKLISAIRNRGGIGAITGRAERVIVPTQALARDQIREREEQRAAGNPTRPALVNQAGVRPATSQREEVSQRLRSEQQTAGRNVVDAGRAQAAAAARAAALRGQGLAASDARVVAAQTALVASTERLAAAQAAARNSNRAVRQDIANNSRLAPVNRIFSQQRTAPALSTVAGAAGRGLLATPGLIARGARGAAAGVGSGLATARTNASEIRSNARTATDAAAARTATAPALAQLRGVTTGLVTGLSGLNNRIQSRTLGPTSAERVAANRTATAAQNLNTLRSQRVDPSDAAAVAARGRALAAATSEVVAARKNESQVVRASTAEGQRVARADAAARVQQAQRALGAAQRSPVPTRGGLNALLARQQTIGTASGELDRALRDQARLVQEQTRQQASRVPGRGTLATRAAGAVTGAATGALNRLPDGLSRGLQGLRQQLISATAGTAGLRAGLNTVRTQAAPAAAAMSSLAARIAQAARAANASNFATQGRAGLGNFAQEVKSGLGGIGGILIAVAAITAAVASTKRYLEADQSAAEALAMNAATDSVADFREVAEAQKTAAEQAKEATSGFFGPIVNAFAGGSVSQAAKDLELQAAANEAAANRAKAQLDRNASSVTPTVDLSSTENLNTSIESLQSSGRGASTIMAALSKAITDVGSASEGTVRALTEDEKKDLSADTKDIANRAVRTTATDIQNSRNPVSNAIRNSPLGLGRFIFGSEENNLRSLNKGQQSQLDTGASAAIEAVQAAGVDLGTSQGKQLLTDQLNKNLNGLFEGLGLDQKQIDAIIGDITGNVAKKAIDLQTNGATASLSDDPELAAATAAAYVGQAQTAAQAAATAFSNTAQPSDSTDTAALVSAQALVTNLTEMRDKLTAAGASKESLEQYDQEIATATLALNQATVENMQLTAALSAASIPSTDTVAGLDAQLAALEAQYAAATDNATRIGIQTQAVQVAQQRYAAQQQAGQAQNLADAGIYDTVAQADVRASSANQNLRRIQNGFTVDVNGQQVAISGDRQSEAEAQARTDKAQADQDARDARRTRAAARARAGIDPRDTIANAAQDVDDLRREFNELPAEAAEQRATLYRQIAEKTIAYNDALREKAKQMARAGIDPRDTIGNLVQDYNDLNADLAALPNTSNFDGQRAAIQRQLTEKQQAISAQVVEDNDTLARLGIDSRDTVGNLRQDSGKLQASLALLPNTPAFAAQRAAIQKQINDKNQAITDAQIEANAAIAQGALDPRDTVGRLAIERTKLVAQLIALGNDPALESLRAALRGAIAQNDLDTQSERGAINNSNNLSALSPGDSVGQAREQLRYAREQFAQASPVNKEYGQLLAQVKQSQVELATSIAAAAANARKLGIDITNPVQSALSEYQAAIDQVNALRGAGASLESIQAAQGQANQAKASYQSSQFNEEIYQIQTQEQLDRISHGEAMRRYRALRSNLASQLAAMSSTDTAYDQIAKQIDQIDQALKSASDSMNSQFNIGDIRIPTPFEVRRSLDQQLSGAGVTQGGNTSTANYITINGGDMAQVLAVIADVMGTTGAAATTTNAAASNYKLFV